MSFVIPTSKNWTHFLFVHTVNECDLSRNFILILLIWIRILETKFQKLNCYFSMKNNFNGEKKYISELSSPIGTLWDPFTLPLPRIFLKIVDKIFPNILERREGKRLLKCFFGWTKLRNIFYSSLKLFFVAKI